MLDQDTLRPVIIAMSLYIIIATLVPRFVTTPSGIEFIDDIVMTLIAQKDSMMSGTIIVGLIVFATNYIQDKFF
jgi:hypothetical protein